MRTVAIVLALVACVSAFNLNAPVINENMIEKINSANAGWTAGVNKKFEGMTIREARAMLGALPASSHLPRTSFASPAAPTANGEFDARTQWPECSDLIEDIQDQGRCGSCWAFAAAQMLSDRFCIATSGAHNAQLSPQDMVSCDTSNLACRGGYPDRSMAYLVNTGVVLDSCFPYVSGKAGDVPECPSECPGEGEWVKYSGSDARDVSGVASMEADLTGFGPLWVGFSVYEDFMQYTGGIYRHTSGGVLGGHAVELIGYGEEDGEEYWLIVNSWGSSWGESGMFRILKGTNECNLEGTALSTSANPNSGLPKIFNLFNKL